jgi:hypothetical protein
VADQRSRQTIPVCERYTEGESYYDNDISTTHYYAAPACDELPEEVRREDWVIEHGYAVGLAGHAGFSRWFFFTALAPAVAFGRAGRMSRDAAASVGVYEAAHELMFCDRHKADEHLLLIRPRGEVDRNDDGLQLKQLKRFVQSCKEHSWSSNWREPTGFITQLDPRARIQETTQRSLPL